MYLIVDQHNAYERIYYENLINILETNSLGTQQQLFPQQIELSSTDAAILKEIKSDLDILGFDINEFGANTFVVNGIPVNTKIENLQEVIEEFIDSYKKGLGHGESLLANERQQEKKMNIAVSMAKSMSGKVNRYMNEVEMLAMIDQLFACKIPHLTTDGKFIRIRLPNDRTREPDPRAGYPTTFPMPPTTTSPPGASSNTSLTRPGGATWSCWSQRAIPKAASTMSTPIARCYSRRVRMSGATTSPTPTQASRD